MTRTRKAGNAARWVVRYEGAPAESNTHDFVVGRETWKDHEYIGVYYDPSLGNAFCLRCSGPLAAMMTSCRHARAVMRAIRAGRFPDVTAPSAPPRRRRARAARVESGSTVAAAMVKPSGRMRRAYFAAVYALGINGDGLDGERVEAGWRAFCEMMEKVEPALSADRTRGRRPVQ